MLVSLASPGKEIYEKLTASQRKQTAPHLSMGQSDLQVGGC